MLVEVRALSSRVQELEGHVTTQTGLATRVQYKAMFVSLVILSMVVLFIPLVTAVYFPNLTVAQSFVLRTVMALAGATLAAIIPGTLGVASSRSRIILRSTVALVMFVILYLVGPIPYIK